MATPEPDPPAPKTFISYSWDDPAHREWVRQLAIRLREDGVAVTLDQWDVAPGDQIPAFMERAVRENDFVIAVCTPRFKEKSDGRGGGVGYEGDIMTAYAFTAGAKKKFIPVLRLGGWVEAAPTWLLGRAKIDLSGDPYSEPEYEELLRTLHSAREEAPPIGSRPDFGDKKRSQPGPVPAPVTPDAGPSAHEHRLSVTPLDGMPARTISLQITIRIGLQELPPFERQWLPINIARFLGILVSSIVIVGVTKLVNGVRVSIILPEEAGRSLLRAFRERDPRLAESLGPMTISETADNALTEGHQHRSPATTDLPGARRTRIFVAYSHRDRKWLERLKVHIKALEPICEIDLWDDSRIAPGDDWRREILEALKATKIAVLLVSADFLASDFIREKELPLIVEAAKTDAVQILPVLVSPCQYKNTPHLKDLQSINHDSKPLTGMSLNEREGFWVKLTDEIIEILKFIGLLEPYYKPGPPPEDRPGRGAGPTAAARVLVVENSDDWQGILSSEIGQALPGSELSVAGTFQDGVRQLSGGGWDLIVTDIGLPPSEGIDLGMLFVRLAKKENVPCIVVSGTAPLTRQNVRDLLVGELYMARDFFDKDEFDAREKRRFQDAVRGIVDGRAIRGGA
jgi:hypothetical protein